MEVDHPQSAEALDSLMGIVKKIILFFLPLTINCQSIADAVNFSLENEVGNSRYASMGGAFGALGGNLSAISLNPASSSVFELSRLGFTINSISNSTTTNYNSSDINNIKSSTNIKSNNSNYQAGVVYVLKNSGSGNFKKFALGVNFQSQQNYNSNFIISGISMNSVDEYFLNNSSGIIIKDISVGSNETIQSVYKRLGDNLGYSAQQAFLGYQSYLLNYDSNSNSFYSLAKYDEGLRLNHEVISSGYNNLVSLNMSWKFKDNLYFGVNLNFNQILTEKETIHIENEFDADSPVTDIDFRNYLLTKGNGISLQAGLIYKLNNLRIGMSYSSKSSIKFEDNLEQYMQTNSVDINGTLYSDTINPEVSNIYFYKFKTPSKLILSAATVIKNMFIISADLISKNYSKSKFSHQNIGIYNDLNNGIKKNLATVLDYKLGTELKINQFSLRGGYKVLNSPYKKFGEKYLSSKTFGIGYNFELSTLDLTLISSKYNFNYQLFDTGLTNKSIIDNNQIGLLLSYNIIF